MKKEGITLAYFAVGSSIKFSKKKLLRSDGSYEYYRLLKLFLRNPAISRILLLSRSDWARITPQEREEYDPEGKLFDPYKEFPEIKNRPKPTCVEDKFDYYSKFYEILEQKEIRADYGIGFISQGWLGVSLPGYANTLKPPFKLANSLDMTLYYASDIIYYLNMSNLKWWLLATDPRYVKPNMGLRDNSNLPQKVLGQQDFDIDWFTLKEPNREASLENGGYVTRQLKSIYSGIEKMNLMNEGILDPSYNKPHKFTIVSMQLSPPSSKKDQRFNILKEYILDHDPNAEARIFGKWSDYFKQNYPQFKGYIATEDLDKTFAETRYTLVLPTAAGWVTSKYAEMLQLGVLPFFHPNYDNQYHILSKDHPIRLKDANDFYNKMNYYDENPNERIAIVRELQETLIKDAPSGKFMIDLFNNSLKEAGINKLLDDSPRALFENKQKEIIEPIKETTLLDFFE